MARYTALLLALLSIDVTIAFLLPRHSVPDGRSMFLMASEDLGELTVPELKARLRSVGMPVVGAKKDLIERLSSASPTSALPASKEKKVSRIGGLLLRRKPKAAAADESEDTESREKETVKKIEIEQEVFEMPVIAVKKPRAEKTVEAKAVAPVKQWGSRKDLVEKTPAVEVKRAPVMREEVKKEVVEVKKEEMKDVTKTPVLDSKKPIKSVKQVVAAYDIDDDDFMSQFMDGSDKRPVASTRSAPVNAGTTKVSSEGDAGIVGAAGDGERQAWPGPGVSWMPGPVQSSSKQDQNRGRNALMAAADDDLQRMVDQRNEARYKRDYDGADAIREELRTIYRVEIYDKLGEWVAADGRWGLSNRKRGAGSEDGVPVLAKIAGDAKPCTLSYEQVMDMVVKRTTARRTRQFQVADDIRDELSRMGVELFDKVNEWRTYDGVMRGIQSEDFEKYEVKKDNERYDTGGRRDKTW